MVTGDQELQWAYLLCPTFELSNSEGKPLTNGYIELYIAGTRDKYYAASDFAGTLHPFQIPLDSLGSNIVLVSPDNAYDIYVYNRFGNLVMSRYNVVPTNGAAGGGSSSSNISIESGDGTVVVTESTDPETGVKTFDLSVPSVSGNSSFWTGRGAATMGVTISDTEYHKLDISNHSIRNRNDDITVVDGEFNLKKGVYFWNVTVQLDKYDGHDNTRQRVFIESGYNRGAYTMDMTHDETETISFSGITVADYDDTKQDIKIKSEGESPFKAVLYNVSIHKLNQNVLGDSSGGHTYLPGDYIEITEDDVINVTGLTTPEDVEAMIDTAITALASGDIYTAGDYINIDNHVISVTGLQPEGDYLTSEDLEGYATETYVDNSVSSFTTHTEVYEATVTAIEAATTAIPDSEEVEFEEINLEDYALASAIPVVELNNSEQVTAIDGHTLAAGSTYTAGDYIDITNDVISVTGLDNSNIFWTVYNSTTYADTLAAYNAGKKILAYESGAIWTLIYKSGNPDTFMFTRIIEPWNATGPKLQYMQLSSRDGWYKSSGYPLQADWNETYNYYPSYIKNKPSIPQIELNGDSLVTSIDGHEIAGVGFEQVQSNWTEADNTDPSYIQNKPEEVRLVAGDNVNITETATSVVISASGGGAEYTAGSNIEINNDAISLKDVVHIDSRNEAPEGYILLGNIVHWGHDDYGPGIMVSATMDDYMDSRSYVWYNTSDQGRDERFWGQYDYDREAMSVSGESYLSIHEGDIQYRRGDFNGTGNLPVIWSCSGMRYDIDRLQEAVTAIPAAQIQSNWNETDTSSPAYIQNKPNLNLYATDTEVYNAVVTGIQVATGLIPAAQVQSNWTEDDTTDPSYIQNKPAEKFLVGGDNVNITETATSVIISTQGGGGSTYTAGNGIDITNDVISVDDTVAMASALPTTELGKFTIQSNVSGGPIEVICPTDQAPDVVFYQINSVTGYVYASDNGYAVINYYYGETPADFNGSDDAILFTINDNISNINSINFCYAKYESGIGGPNLSSTAIAGGSTGILQSGTYKVKAQYNQATAGGYGKYLEIIFSWKSYASSPEQSAQWAQDTLSKITFFGVVRPDPTLGAVVNLNRYELGNTNTITSTSGYTEACVYTDPATKKQSVYMSYSMPSNWSANNNIAQGFEYGTNCNGPSNYYNYNTKLYKAFKYTSSPRRYQFAYCTDWDEANKVMTFVAYDNSGNAIEKWTLDYTTYSSNVWTTTPISSGGTEYTAGDYISIENDEIAVTGVGNLVAGNNITITESGNNITISSEGGGSTYTAGQYISIDSNDEIAVTGLAPVSGSNGITVNNNVVSLDTPVEIVPGDNITISVTGASAIISAQGGSSTYSAGNGIDITNDVISIDNTVALKTDIPVVTGFATVSQVSAVSAAIPDVSNFVTDTEVTTEITEAVSGKQNMLTGITDVQVVTGLPASPTQDVLYLIVEA